MLAPPCAAIQPWRFDDLSGAPDIRIQTGVSTFDDLWQEQIRAMDRAQEEMADMQRLMDQRFAAARAEARQAEQQVERQQQHGGSCGSSWQRSWERGGPGGAYHEWRSESFTVIGVPPPGCQGMHVPPAPSALHLGPLHGAGLLVAAAVAGFWAALTTTFHRRFYLTTYKESSRWLLLLAWPFLLPTSAQFRQQFVAALRGQRAPPAHKEQPKGRADGEQFGPSM